MEPVEILRSALELIRDEDRWCRYTFARGKSKRKVQVFGAAAVQFCSVGALIRVRDTGSESAFTGDARRALEQASQALFGDDVVGVNDRLGHADVLAMFKQAIADLEAGQP